MLIIYLMNVIWAGAGLITTFVWSCKEGFWIGLCWSSINRHVYSQRATTTCGSTFSVMTSRLPIVVFAISAIVGFITTRWRSLATVMASSIHSGNIYLLQFLGRSTSAFRSKYILNSRMLIGPSEYYKISPLIQLFFLWVC